MSQVWVVCFLLILSADVAKMNDVNRTSVHLRNTLSSLFHLIHQGVGWGAAPSAISAALIQIRK